MKLSDNWKEILTKAWSMRFMFIAAILTGLEFILPFIETTMPRGIFAMFAFFVTTLAMIARLVYQKDV
jgi:hypothetical protein